MKTLHIYRKHKKGWCSDVPGNLKFLGHRLAVEQKVDEPSNIKWENLDVSTGEKCWRMCVVIIAVIGIMLATFFIIFVANIVKPTSSESCPENEFTLVEAQTTSNSFIKDCYCKARSLSELKNDSTIYELCYDTYIRYIMTTRPVSTEMTVVQIYRI